MPMITMTVDDEQFRIDTNLSRFTAAELNAVERHTGMTVEVWGEKLQDLEKVSSLAWSALIWIAVRRGGRFERWDEFTESLRLADVLATVSFAPDRKG